MARLPSAQAEIDRARLGRLPTGAVPYRDGPLTLPPGVRLSTNPVFRLEEAPINLIYEAEVSCKSCSIDLEALKRDVPGTVRVIALPEAEDRDAALRQVLSLYRFAWPLLLGKGLPALLKLVEHPDWRLFFLTREGVERFMFEAHQQGLLEYHAAGSVTRLSFPVTTLEEYAHVLAQRAH